MPARLGFFPFAFPAGDDQAGPDGLGGLAGSLAAQDGAEHVTGDDGWPSAVPALARGGAQAFADVLASGPGHCGEEPERHPARAGRAVHAG